MILRLSNKIFVPLCAILFSIASQASSETSIDEITGTWGTDYSSAKIHIYISDQRVEIKAWDSSDVEKFQVSNVSWNTKELKAKFLMPSTGYITDSTFTLIGPGQMQEKYSGSGTGKLMWQLEKP